VLKQLFIMHPVKFVAKTITEFGKQASVDVYELDSVNDFSYLINDLKPEIILVHVDSVENELTIFMEQVDAAEFKGVKLGLLQEKPSEISDQFDIIIQLPVEPASLLEQLKHSCSTC
jgi:hypothetical protein